MTMNRICFLIAVVALGCADSKVRLGEDDSSIRPPQPDASAPHDGGAADTAPRPDAVPIDTGSGPQPCGDNICAPGQFCCNESCGLCAPEGGACPDIACNGGVVCSGIACELPNAQCCPGCRPGESFCSTAEGVCPELDCPPPPTCGGVACGADEECCPGCSPGDERCVPAGSCTPPPCPPPPLCGDTPCADGDLCCPLCPDQAACFPGPSCPDVDLICPAPPSCAPMAARGVGPCLLLLGVAWNGRNCVSVGGCECEGSDCGRLYRDLRTCEAENFGCPGCATSRDCAPGAYCDGCAHGSCPACDDCVADCQPTACRTEERPTCRALRPECQDDEVAVVRNGCWVCVNRSTCEPIAVPMP